MFCNHFKKKKKRKLFVAVSVFKFLFPQSYDTVLNKENSLGLNCTILYAAYGQIGNCDNHVYDESIILIRVAVRIQSIILNNRVRIMSKSEKNL